jgi:hypothetical protein
MRFSKTAFGALALSTALVVGTTLPSAAQMDRRHDNNGSYSRSNDGKNNVRRSQNGPKTNFRAQGPNFRAQGNVSVTSNNRTNFNFDRSKFERRGDTAFYNNHRGYRERHAGYRYYNGFWFPPAAFVAGAIIGSAVGSAPYYGSGYYAYGDAHTQWCEQNYRSYDIATDTFQPYVGPRQRCVSPYDY